MKKGKNASCYEQEYDKIYLITQDSNCIQFDGDKYNYKVTVKENNMTVSRFGETDVCKGTPTENINLKCFTCSGETGIVKGMKGYCPSKRPPTSSGSSSLFVLFMITLLYFIF